MTGLVAYSSPSTKMRAWALAVQHSLFYEQAAKLIQQDYGVRFGPKAIESWDVATKNAHGVLPQETQSTAPSRWHEHDEAADQEAVVAVEGGNGFQLIYGWKYLELADAKAQAFDEIEAYYYRYETSQFTHNGQVFTAADPFRIRYQGLALSNLRSTLVLPIVVFDINRQSLSLATAEEVAAFYTDYESLQREAHGVAAGAHQQVVDATSTEQVAGIVAALPNIPGAV